MSTRDERRAEAMRKRRLGRREAAQRMRRQQQIKRAIVIAAGVLAIAAVAWLGYSFIDSQRQKAADEAALGDVQEYELEAGHVQDPVTYGQNPPAGGPHYSTWQNCGYYSAPIVNEYAAHSLEHGAVWITYRPDLPADQVEILRQKADQTFVLVSPYPEDLPAPIVASAWGRQMTLDSADDDALDAFLREFRQGSNAPEVGASCTSTMTSTR